MLRKVIKISQLIFPFQDLMMECLLYQIAELGCPNVCYAVDIKGSTLEKAEEQEVKCDNCL